MTSSTMIGSSEKFLAVLNAIRQVAGTKCTVLLQGETGTGKEVAARAIHSASLRSGRVFAALNCAAIPAALLEAELFGHERGAFTGAVARATGRFEAARGGTFFLDEIGDLPLDLQPKLLRVLQEQQFERLGGRQTVDVDVRIIAATSHDLPSMVEARTFRADLYYRLNVFPITLPPLRDRAGDIPDFVTHFVKQFAGCHGKAIDCIPDAVVETLLRHDWPGNIRELQNVIERAVITTSGPSLQLPACGASGSERPASLQVMRTLDEAQRDHITEVLAAAGGRIGGSGGAAARLGLPRSTLLSRMRKLGMFPPEPLHVPKTQAALPVALEHPRPVAIDGALPKAHRLAQAG